MRSAVVSLADLAAPGKVIFASPFTPETAMASTVVLGSKHQIVVPREARDKLKIGPGEELLALYKEDRLVLIPKPRDYVRCTAACTRKSDRAVARRVILRMNGEAGTNEEIIRSCSEQASCE